MPESLFRNRSRMPQWSHNKSYPSYTSYLTYLTYLTYLASEIRPSLPPAPTVHPKRCPSDISLPPTSPFAQASGGRVATRGRLRTHSRQPAQFTRRVEDSPWRGEASLLSPLPAFALSAGRTTVATPARRRGGSSAPMDTPRALLLPRPAPHGSPYYSSCPLSPPT